MAAAGLGRVLTGEAVGEVAAELGVCVRPILRLVTDRQTGAVEQVTLPCGSTRESVCAPCAAKALRLRMQQCAEGWHLEQDPLGADDPENDPDDDDDDGPEGQGSRRHVRSTRRRQDVVELLRIPAEDRSIGQTFTAPDGTTYRPSMFVTLTLGAYGRIAPGTGTPAKPSTYDYWRAALEALHFPRLFDRWMQNLRRCAGYRVQYFGAIEPQRRLAPHIHLAIRGAIPRQVIRTVTQATYLQLRWPSFETPVYRDAESMPAWNPTTERVEDSTGVALTSWDEALDELDADPEAEPAVVMRFGNQVDIQGIIAPSRDADRAIRYLTKYLTKTVAETYTDPDREVVDERYEAHIDRLHREVRWLPCSPDCSNWIRYGIEPKDPGPGLIPGMCPNKAHDRENLGIGGRRVQVSRAWSGKTLAEHKSDRATVVREVLAAAGIEAPATDRMSADALADDGLPRYVWEPVPTDQAAYATTVLLSIAQAKRWRAEYEHAKQQFADRSRASPHEADPGPVDSRSATIRAAGPSHHTRGSAMEKQKDTAATDRLWTVEEVSYYLGVPVNTLYLWRSEGRGPASRRVGRHLRYRSEDVKVWVEKLDGWAILGLPDAGPPGSGSASTATSPTERAARG